MTKLSIVIPTFERRHLLERTLRSVLAQDVAPEDYEVVVVVDGSTDGTAQYLRTLHPECSLKIVEQANAGPARARNAGIAASSGEIVLFLDDDCLCERDLVRRHLRAHGPDANQIVFGPHLVAPDAAGGLAAELIARSSARYFSRMADQGGPRSAFEVWITSNCSLPRSLLLSIGGYDEQCSFPGEDDDLAIRLWNAGAKFRFESTIVTQHLYAKRADDLVNDYGRRAAESDLVLVRKYPDYLAHSPLGVWRNATPAKYAVYSLLCAAPGAADAILRAMTRSIERVRFMPGLTSVGVRLLQLRVGVACASGARRAPASGSEIDRELGV